MGSALANADGVNDLFRELTVNDIINFGRAKSNPGRIQDTIGSTQEKDLVCGGIDRNKVSLCPDIYGNKVNSIYSRGGVGRKRKAGET